MEAQVNISHWRGPTVQLQLTVKEAKSLLDGHLNITDCAHKELSLAVNIAEKIKEFKLGK